MFFKIDSDDFFIDKYFVAILKGRKDAVVDYLWCFMEFEDKKVCKIERFVVIFAAFRKEEAKRIH